MQSGGDSFVTKGFNSWNEKEKLDLHVGGVNSAHSQALMNGKNLMKQNQHLHVGGVNSAHIQLIMNVSCNDFKIWNLIENNCRIFFFGDIDIFKSLLF